MSLTGLQFDISRSAINITLNFLSQTGKHLYQVCFLNSLHFVNLKKREINFLHTVNTANCKLWNFSLSLKSIFSAQNSLCVPQCKENEFFSFFSWLTIWRDIQKCYRAHLVMMLSYLARKSQSYFDSFVTAEKWFTSSFKHVQIIELSPPKLQKSIFTLK